ncbi:MAG TPA: Maf family protein [Usitatibacteraceae bacterium]|nr:Maf family protein [Usitatibacteraceae bacterium]
MSTHSPEIIYLASKSPRRRELLKQVGIHFELMLTREKAPRCDVDEAPLPEETPHQYVQRVVRLKAECAVKAMRERRLPPRPLLTADTTVTIDGRILGKPLDRVDALAMLALLSGNTHQVLTAVAVSDTTRTEQILTTSFVTFDRLGDDEMKRYVDSGEPMDKAGGYAVQGMAARFISKLSGSYSGVMGLPLYETVKLLRQFGVPL